MSGSVSLRPFDPFRGVERLGALWTLRRGQETAVCLLRTHPSGWEIKAFAGRELIRSEVCKNTLQVFDSADGWRIVWEQKGWRWC